MLDDSLLDHAEALAAADRGGLLRGAAEAGALTRTAVRHATEAGLAELRPDGRPRALLVAGPGPVAGCAADLLGAFSSGSVPVSLIRPAGRSAEPSDLRWTLPGWAGPLDLLFLLTKNGAEPGLTALADQAYRRGCTVVAVSPAGSDVAEAASPPRGLNVPLATLPFEPGVPDERPIAAPGELWTLLTPLLMLTDRLGLGHAPPDALESLADRLDKVAERCGPAIPTYDNPAKTLAVELADSLPLLWSETPIADAAARHFATMLGALPGRPALHSPLPEALTVHQAVLTGMFAGATGEDDIFRDRVEEPQALRARIVLLHEQPPTGVTAAPAARSLAHRHEAAVSELEASEGSRPLDAAAELIATADFTAVYLALTPSP
ncbi:SIS domain-containing protein [Streptomyces alkaliterrae]|uniref:Mannose-6-phosphate isomerase n=1 Tax=Streptomyces alkaliterrae TaxID=2213162 RepID=A0A5P0YZQ1_9ACTN|nr:SIS domain-containing protein [Streptomyces alkaliterrae]MBB1261324.1 mannose-6-phosphate isomerase [Streptomyces alkaliterrae]MQS04179.1 mannose-6-phosphate isomerase [Streptomyces alkaliterrae]